MDQQRTHEHGRHRIPGYAERHERNERAADTRIVCGFRACEALGHARAELGRAFREALLLCVGDGYGNS